MRTQRHSTRGSGLRMLSADDEVTRTSTPERTESEQAESAGKPQLHRPPYSLRSMVVSTAPCVYNEHRRQLLKSVGRLCEMFALVE